MAKRRPQKGNVTSGPASKAGPPSAPSREGVAERAIRVIRDIDVFDPGCGAHEVIARLGNKWSLLVIYSLVQGTKRYTELQKQIRNVSPKMLTQVLRSLEKDGLVSRAVHPVVPPMVEYTLTPLGASLAGPLAELCVWAEENDAILKKMWRIKSG